MKNSKGQVSVEIVLMLALMVGIMTLVSTSFRNNELIASLVSGPWKHLSGLIQNGSWGTPTETMTQHPNRQDRVSSPRGELVK